MSTEATVSAAMNVIINVSVKLRRNRFSHLSPNILHLIDKAFS